MTHVSLTLDSDCLHIPTLASATTAIDSVCPECGMAKKYGKSSCCGRGGSWFGDCGSAGNSNLGHTWQEGIQVCKGRQFQTALVQQLHAFQSNTGASSIASVMNTNTGSQAVAVATHVVTLTRVNSSTPILGTIDVFAKASTITPADTSVTVREFGKLLSVVNYIGMTCIIFC